MAVKHINSATTSREFFQDERQMRCQAERSINSIRELKDGVLGPRHAETKDMLEKVAKPYWAETIYCKRPYEAKIRFEVSKKINDKLPKEAVEKLDREMDTPELEKMIDGLARCKSPGSDGIPSEFYLAFKKELAPVLLLVFEACSSKGVLTKSQRHSVIALLHKKQDKEDIRNYRPISLTNIDYNIFSSVLANRMRPVMKYLIHDDQSIKRASFQKDSSEKIICCYK
jgi:hypothetical protein